MDIISKDKRSAPIFFHVAIVFFALLHMAWKLCVTWRLSSVELFFHWVHFQFAYIWQLNDAISIPWFKQFHKHLAHRQSFSVAPSRSNKCGHLWILNLHPLWLWPYSLSNKCLRRSPNRRAPTKSIGTKYSSKSGLFWDHHFLEHDRFYQRKNYSPIPVVAPKQVERYTSVISAREHRVRAGVNVFQPIAGKQLIQQHNNLKCAIPQHILEAVIL